MYFKSTPGAFVPFKRSAHYKNLKIADLVQCIYFTQKKLHTHGISNLSKITHLITGKERIKTIGLFMHLLSYTPVSCINNILKQTFFLFTYHILHSTYKQ